MHDDVVAVEVLPEQEWATPFSLVIDDKDDDQGDLVIEQVIECIANEHKWFTSFFLPVGRNRFGCSWNIVEENCIVSCCCNN